MDKAGKADHGRRVVNSDDHKASSEGAGDCLSEVLSLVYDVCYQLREAQISAGFEPDHYSVLAKALAVKCVLQDRKQRAQIDDKQALEIERLRRALHEIAEEWAGAECGEPVYAQEAYAIGLARRMYNLAVDALKTK